MPGAEAIAVIGLIAAVIDIVQATKKVYDAANDATGLPEAFREVAKNLPLVEDTLRLVKDSVDEKTCTVINPVIKTCEVKAGSLKKLFDEVVPKEGAKRMERYVKALRSLGKGSRVEDLMGEILEELQLLAARRVFNLQQHRQGQPSGDYDYPSKWYELRRMTLCKIAGLNATGLLFSPRLSESL